MKYGVSVTINKPIDEVVSKFDNADNYKHWMDGLQQYETVSGVQLQTGAVSKLSFLMGKRKMEMTEKVLSKNLPEDYTVSYEANKVYNTVKSSFEKIDENTTRYTTNQEFQFEGIVMKFFGFVMPGAFKKQSQKYLNDFKAFVEA